MIIRLRNNLRREDGRTVLTYRHRADDLGGTCFISDTEEYTERFAQGFAMLGTCLVLTTIQVTSVITFFLHPEVLVDGLLQRFSLLSILLDIFLVAQQGCHILQHVQHPIVSRIGAETFTQVDVCRLCPCGIALFAPVDERTFAAEQSCLRIIHHHEIAFQTTCDNGISLLHPFHVARSEVDVPCSQRPHHTV